LSDQLTRNEAIAALTSQGQRFELEEILNSAGDLVRSYKNAPRSLREIVMTSEQLGDQEFIVFEEIRWTFADHALKVRKLACYLQNVLGLKKGDRFGIAMRNLPEFSVAFSATQVLGVVAVPLNAWWTGSEMVRAIRDAEVVAVVADGERWDRLIPELGNVDLRGALLVGPPGELVWGSLQPLENVWNLQDSGWPDVKVNAEDLSTIVYTSGTSGIPKGAMHLHSNHCTSVMTNLLGAEILRVQSPDMPISPATPPVALLTFPMFHIAGLVNLYLAMVNGSKLVLIRRWDTEVAVDLIFREHITSTVVVPTVLRQLLDNDRLRNSPSNLKNLGAGGAPVPAELIRRIDSQFDHRVMSTNGYGLTETTAGVIVLSGAEYVLHPDSVGYSTVVTDVRLVGLDSVEVLSGEVGEIWVKGPNVSPGYWNNPSATEESFFDGWFRTGDLARQDHEGRYYIVDRLKDVVIRGGENVYTSEVEKILMEHPNVIEAAVFGIANELLGEEVVGVVKLLEVNGSEEEGLRDFVRERLAYFKVPVRIFEWLEELPRTASGKVLKRDLREQVLLKLLSLDDSL
jgi:acyl-CoA synthetase (AMP-forming)/AMP-acid ligase II